jgi:hypothetical protein
VDLLGRWVVRDGRVFGDPTTERIEFLIQRCLRQFAEDSSGWTTLFIDPGDDRLWERTYPYGAMQGGGPPRLTLVSEQEARKRYDLRRFPGRITKQSFEWRGRHAEILRVIEGESA